MRVLTLIENGRIETFISQLALDGTSVSDFLVIIIEIVDYLCLSPVKVIRNP